MLALALFDVLAPAKRPRDAGVGVAHFVAGVAAAGLFGGGGSWGTVASTAVIGVEMGGVFVRVARVGLAVASSHSPPLTECLVPVSIFCQRAELTVPNP